MPVTRAPAPQRPDRRGRIEHPSGFTLVELLVAIVLIQIALLALVATSGVLIRQTTAVRARVAAVSAATNRLQLLGGARCVASSGVSAEQGRVERWSVELRPNGVRELWDSVTFASFAATHFLVLRTRLPC